MDVTRLLPCSIDFNTFKAYNEDRRPTRRYKLGRLDALNLEWNITDPKSLRCLALDKIIENWQDNPIYSQLSRQVDKNYILDRISVNIPIHITSAHIKEDIFWRKCFQSRWKNYNPSVNGQQWIQIYMEKHLAELLEDLEVFDYDQERIQEILDVCAAYVERLDLSYLQPSMGDRPDHIPLNYILASLPELRKFRITFSTKTIGTQYYLGCSWPSKNDIIHLGRGLEKSYELTNFCLHRTRLEPYMLKIIAQKLDKGCSNLTRLAITDCRFGDNGVVQFLNVLYRESFPVLKELVLSNNLLSQESALLIGRALKGRCIELLDIRLNPIGSDGAGALFSFLGTLPIKVLNVSACSITETVTRLLLKLLIESQTLLDIDISNNDLGFELGRDIYRVIGFNKILKKFDLRNTGTSTEHRNEINAVVFQNRDKL